ncbi:uncharacterized protein LOC132737469 isoform X2 [Ruditapes philippinarum]|uniref:uncharacterized protein LOC132737469 isoform X2 n=1 Tax=Ruditapes philippinarum TaxID=129788 RepID=UPI00295BC48B|nr:uncharacterized protein LOC132737469 isoform X2 [Ruditapes philippinarum]
MCLLKMSPLVCVYLIFIGISFVQAEKMYSTNNSSSWLKSTKTCDLATPPYENYLGELKVTLTVDISQEHWIGYFKAFIGFEYIACIPFVELRAKKTLPSMDQGICYSACGKKPIFGIRSQTCYCEDEIGYDKSLPYSFVVDCVSIYKVNKDVVKNHPEGADESKCMTFQTQRVNRNQLSKLYKWTSCGQYYYRYCENENIGRHNEKIHAWKESAAICFNRSSHSLTYNELRATNLEFTSPVWTSIICSDVIHEYKEYDYRLPNCRFCYVSGTKSGVVLKFTSDDTQYKALCIDGQRETTSTRSTITSSNSVSTRQSDVKELSTSISRISSASETTAQVELSSTIGLFSSETTSIHVKESQMSQSSSIIVPVGVSSIAVTVVVLVVVFVVLKRRGKIPTTCFRNVQSDSSDYAIPEIHQVDQHDYASLGLNQGQVSGIELPSTTYTDYNAIHGNNEHTYSELETHAEASNTDANIESHYYNY